MERIWFHRIAVIATVLALGVVVLGAYVRLSNAGLGCPDWPGCYGHIAVPEAHKAVASAEQAFPGRPVEPAKAWKEMIHRYFAGTLGTLILILAILAWRNRRDARQEVVLPLGLVVLVIFQALLGMWTVTLLLKPLVVMSHLLGGMSTLALLLLLVLRDGRYVEYGADFASPWPRRLALGGLVILAIQIALGGWTSSNYAALACPDFPKCQGSWWPDMDFKDAFVLWRGLGIDYQGGILQSAARAAIHYTHRIGALVTFLYLFTLGASVLARASRRGLRLLGAAILVLVTAQASLGISIVEFGLPLPLAVAHNGTAALLLLSVVALNHALWRGRRTGVGVLR